MVSGHRGWKSRGHLRILPTPILNKLCPLGESESDSSYAVGPGLAWAQLHPCVPFERVHSEFMSNPLWNGIFLRLNSRFEIKYDSSTVAEAKWNMTSILEFCMITWGVIFKISNHEAVQTARYNCYVQIFHTWNTWLNVSDIWKCDYLKFKFIFCICLPFLFNCSETIVLFIAMMD